jgi:hypothetical protein
MRCSLGDMGRGTSYEAAHLRHQWPLDVRASERTLVCMALWKGLDADGGVSPLEAASSCCVRGKTAMNILQLAVREAA